MEIKSKEQQLKELQENITQLQEQINKLAEEVFEEEKTEDCLINSKNNSPAKVWCLVDDNSEFEAVPCYSDNSNDMHFADEEQCKRYAGALTTFILLRKQPGSCKVEDEEQWSIFIDTNDLYVESFHGKEFKLNNVCPSFNSYESAQKALDTVGEERIKQMLMAFHS